MVIACSKEAKALGCKKVMRVPEALKVCPDLVLVTHVGDSESIQRNERNDSKLGMKAFKVPEIAKAPSLERALAITGGACWLIVVLIHVAEWQRIFPGMGWGLPASPGHYLDLFSAIGGTALLLAALLTHHVFKLTHYPAAASRNPSRCDLCPQYSLDERGPPSAAWPGESRRRAER